MSRCPSFGALKQLQISRFHLLPTTPICLSAAAILFCGALGIFSNQLCRLGFQSSLAIHGECGPRSNNISPPGIFLVMRIPVGLPAATSQRMFFREFRKVLPELLHRPLLQRLPFRFDAAERFTMWIGFTAGGTIIGVLSSTFRLANAK